MRYAPRSVPDDEFAEQSEVADELGCSLAELAALCRANVLEIRRRGDYPFRVRRPSETTVRLIRR